MDKNAFISQPEDIKTSYLVIMGAIASADHTNSEAEIADIEQMSAVAGLSDSSKQIVKNALTDLQGANLPAHLEKFKDNQIKFALISDLLNLANSDGNINDVESQAVQAVATELGVSGEQFDALKQYILVANKEAAKTPGSPLPEAKEGQPSFLERMGLKSVFDKLGIPVEHFLAGTTITAALGTVAYMFLQNYTKPNAQGSHAGTIGGIVGAWLGGALGGKKEGEADAKANSGMGGMIAGFFASEAGASTINGIINNVAKATSEGKGIGNLMDIIGGGKGEQPILNNILGALLSGKK
jgi:uncharacterized tellurite resistance protein B-like protein